MVGPGIAIVAAHVIGPRAAAIKDATLCQRDLSGRIG